MAGIACGKPPAAEGAPLERVAGTMGAPLITGVAGLSFVATDVREMSGWDWGGGTIFAADGIITAIFVGTAFAGTG
jgi:hypothetical protein